MLSVRSMSFTRRKRPPATIKCDSERSCSDSERSPASSSDLLADLATSVAKANAASSDSATSSEVALRQLNVALVAALRAERERSHSLRAQLDKCQKQDDPEDENEEEDAENRVLRSLSLNSAGRPPSSKLLSRKAKRTRVVIDPLAPLKAGAVVDSQAAALAAAVASSRNSSEATEAAAAAEASPAAAVTPAWPEPSASPPRRKLSVKPQRWPSQTSAAAAAVAEQPLSIGLSSRLRLALSEELHRLQETLNVLLASEPPADSEEYSRSVRSLARRLGWVRSDLFALSERVVAAPAVSSAGVAAGTAAAAEEEEEEEMEGGECGSESFQTLLELAASTEDFVVSLRAELTSQERAAAERRHSEALCTASGMRLVPIEHDGDCLFACAHAWLEHRVKARVSSVGASLDLSDAASSSGAGAEDKAEEAEVMKEEDATSAIASLCSSAADVRQLVVDMMRERSCGEASAEAGALDELLADRMRVAVREAMTGGGSDGTSVALRKAARRHDVGTASAASASALSAYLDVMACTGVYGERLEIETLASLLGTPVHVYYFSGEAEQQPEAEGAAAQPSAEPSEVVVPDGVDPSAEPIKLLHLVHERHFELLLPSP